MPPIKLLLRVARRLHDVWRTRSVPNRGQERSALGRLAACQRAWRQARGRLYRARTHGLTLILPGLRDELLAHVDNLGAALDQVRHHLAHAAPPVPSVPFLLAELQQLEDEFHGLTVDWKRKTIAATTVPVILQGVALGRFAIQLHWGRLAHATDDQCFDIVALEPNPPAANDRVTHPHVKDRALCAGHAATPIRKALEQGRIADAFCLVRSVLRHYNPASPPVPLDEWDGRECAECGTSLSDDEWSCDGCDHDLCGDCREECAACGSVRCSDCLTNCAACKEPYCRNCLKPAAGSGRPCCAGCLVAGAACGAQVAKDELSARRRRFACARGERWPRPGTAGSPWAARGRCRWRRRLAVRPGERAAAATASPGAVPRGTAAAWNAGVSGRRVLALMDLQGLVATLNRVSTIRGEGHRSLLLLLLLLLLLTVAQKRSNFFGCRINGWRHSSLSLTTGVSGGGCGRCT